MDNVIKILFVTNTLPYPVSKNGNTENIFNLIHYLKQDGSFKVDLVFLGNLGKIEEKHINAVEREVHKFFIVNLKRKFLLRFSFFLLKRNLGLNSNYDLLFFNSFLAGYCRFNFSQKKKAVLYQADSRSLFYSRRNGIPSIFKYYRAKLEQKFLFKFFDKIVFVSELDEYESNCYTKLYQKTNVIPIGVNLPKNRSFLKEKKEIDLIFTGNFHFKPNADGAIWFLEEICPSLCATLPDIKICLAGRYPTKMMTLLASKHVSNVEITGEVLSLSDYLSKSKIYISPIYWGAGMKNKILQAMSHNLPIVCTIESTAGIPNKSLFNIVKEKDEWLNAIYKLLADKQLRKSQGEENYITVLNNYRFSIIVERHFIPLFKSMCNF